LRETLRFFNEEFAEYKLDFKKDDLDECPICKNEKKKGLRTCSKSCSAKLSFGIDWDKFDLYDLHVVQKLSNVKIGKLANGFTYYIRKNTEPKNRAYLYLANKVGSNS
jgi:hypothetical protein